MRIFSKLQCLAGVHVSILQPEKSVFCRCYILWTPLINILHIVKGRSASDKTPLVINTSLYSNASKLQSSICFSNNSQFTITNHAHSYIFRKNKQSLPKPKEPFQVNLSREKSALFNSTLSHWIQLLLKLRENHQKWNLNPVFFLLKSLL